MIHQKCNLDSVASQILLDQMMKNGPAIFKIILTTTHNLNFKYSHWARLTLLVSQQTTSNFKAQSNLEKFLWYLQTHLMMKNL